MIDTIPIAVNTRPLEWSAELVFPAAQKPPSVVQAGVSVPDMAPPSKKLKF